MSFSKTFPDLTLYENWANDVIDGTSRKTLGSEIDDLKADNQYTELLKDELPNRTRRLTNLNAQLDDAKKLKAACVEFNEMKERDMLTDFALLAGQTNPQVIMQVIASSHKDILADKWVIKILNDLDSSEFIIGLAAKKTWANYAKKKLRHCGIKKK